MYLSGNLQKNRLHNGVWAWAMSHTKYVQQVLNNYKAHVKVKFNGRFRMHKEAEKLIFYVE